MEIRKAQEADIPAICSFDQVVRTEDERRKFIQDSVRSGAASVAVLADQVVGYTVLEYTFFSRGFISILYVHPDHRRRGVATALVRHVEGLCETDDLFTSTNQSNRPMQALLVKLDYSPSGIVTNLDPGDPEMFYCKHLKGKQMTS